MIGHDTVNRDSAIVDFFTTFEDVNRFVKAWYTYETRRTKFAPIVTCTAADWIEEPWLIVAEISKLTHLLDYPLQGIEPARIPPPWDEFLPPLGEFLRTIKVAIAFGFEDRAPVSALDVHYIENLFDDYTEGDWGHVEKMRLRLEAIALQIGDTYRLPLGEPASWFGELRVEESTVYRHGYDASVPLSPKPLETFNLLLSVGPDGITQEAAAQKLDCKVTALRVRLNNLRNELIPLDIKPRLSVFCLVKSKANSVLASANLG